MYTSNDTAFAIVWANPYFNQIMICSLFQPLVKPNESSSILKALHTIKPSRSIHEFVPSCLQTLQIDSQAMNQKGPQCLSSYIRKHFELWFLKQKSMNTTVAYEAHCLQIPQTVLIKSPKPNDESKMDYRSYRSFLRKLMRKLMNLSPLITIIVASLFMVATGIVV